MHAPACACDPKSRAYVPSSPRAHAHLLEPTPATYLVPSNLYAVDVDIHAPAFESMCARVSSSLRYTPPPLSTLSLIASSPRSRVAWTFHAAPLSPHLCSVPAHKLSRRECHARFSASTRRVRQQRDELGRRRQSIIKVRTTRSRPFGPPFARDLCGLLNAMPTHSLDLFNSQSRL